MNKTWKYLLLFLMSISIPFFAQDKVTLFDFQVFEPLPTIDIGSFITANGLRNTSRLFLVTIAPAGVKVKLQGIINWKDVNETSYNKPLLNYITKEFDSRNFANTDIGVTDIKTEKWEFNKTNVDELKNRGKAVGSFEFIVKLLLPDGNPYPGTNTITRYMTFTNPAQTIFIISPAAESKQQLTNVLAQWVPVVGADEYKVKVGVRTNASQPLSEALNSGVPLADKNVASETSVNLFTLCDRPWQQDQEIVFQVSCRVPGPGGGEVIYSNLVNFKFLNGEERTATKTSSPSYTEEELKRIFGGLTNSDLQNFLYNCGNIIEITDEYGNTIPRDELQRIIDYLKQNPDKVKNVFPNLNKTE